MINPGGNLEGDSDSLRGPYTLRWKATQSSCNFVSMFEVAKAQLATAADKAAHLRRFL